MGNFLVSLEQEMLHFKIFNGFSQRSSEINRCFHLHQNVYYTKLYHSFSQSLGINGNKGYIAPLFSGRQGKP